MFSFPIWLRAGLRPARSRFLACGGLLLAGSTQVYGQVPATSPPRHHSLSLEAQSVANGGKADSATQTKPGAYGGSTADTRVVKSQQNVQFTVRNFDALPDTCTVAWYFIASPVGINGVIPNKEYVLNQGSQDFTVQGTKSEVQTVSSKEVGVVTMQSTESTSRVIYLSKSQGGAVVQGWMVRLIADGRVIATKGSSQKFEDIAKDDGKLKALAPPEPAPATGRQRPAAGSSTPNSGGNPVVPIPTPRVH